MLRYINRKTLSCRESNRSTNFIAPDLITDEAVNCIYWRYLDCNKNAVSMAAHYYFSHKSLHKQNVSKMKDRLLVEQNIIFDKYPSFFKDGTFVKNQSYTKVVNDQSVLRHKVDVKPLTKSFNLYTHEERKDFIFN